MQCELCNNVKAAAYVPTYYGRRHVCEECRLKYSGRRKKQNADPPKQREVIANTNGGAA